MIAPILLPMQLDGIFSSEWCRWVLIGCLGATAILNLGILALDTINRCIETCLGKESSYLRSIDEDFLEFPIRSIHLLRYFAWIPIGVLIIIAKITLFEENKIWVYAMLFVAIAIILSLHAVHTDLSSFAFSEREISWTEKLGAGTFIFCYFLLAVNCILLGLYMDEIIRCSSFLIFIPLYLVLTIILVWSGIVFIWALKRVACRALVLVITASFIALDVIVFITILCLKLDGFVSWGYFQGVFTSLWILEPVIVGLCCCYIHSCLPEI